MEKLDDFIKRLERESTLIGVVHPWDSFAIRREHCKMH